MWTENNLKRELCENHDVTIIRWLKPWRHDNHVISLSSDCCVVKFLRLSVDAAWVAGGFLRSGTIKFPVKTTVIAKWLEIYLHGVSLDSEAQATIYNSVSRPGVRLSTVIRVQTEPNTRQIRLQFFYSAVTRHLVYKPLAALSTKVDTCPTANLSKVFKQSETHFSPKLVFRWKQWPTGTILAPHTPITMMILSCQPIRERQKASSNLPALVAAYANPWIVIGLLHFHCSSDWFKRFAIP